MALRFTYRRSVALVPRRIEIPTLLNARGLVGEAVEIGVQQALFSEYLLRHWTGRRLHLVDPWRSFPSGEYVDRSNVSQEQQDRHYAEALRRVSPFGDRVSIHRMTSREAATRFEDRSLDFVYIDARHDEESVFEDLEAWYPKVRRYGILAGHDYLDGFYGDSEFGVRRAVARFSAQRAFRAWGTYRDTPWVSFLGVVGAPAPTSGERTLGVAVRLLTTVGKRLKGAPGPGDFIYTAAGPVRR